MLQQMLLEDAADTQGETKFAAPSSCFCCCARPLLSDRAPLGCGGGGALGRQIHWSARSARRRTTGKAESRLGGGGRAAEGAGPTWRRPAWLRPARQRPVACAVAAAQICCSTGRRTTGKAESGLGDGQPTEGAGAAWMRPAWRRLARRRSVACARLNERGRGRTCQHMDISGPLVSDCFILGPHVS
ncbi:hypothetical protein ACP4OV_007849 [Aristida adscensionis]